MGTVKGQCIGQGGVGHAYPLETVIGPDLVIWIHTSQRGIIQDLVEHVLGVEGCLLAPDRQQHAGKQNQ
jgi:hypothetical protein